MGWACVERGPCSTRTLSTARSAAARFILNDFLDGVSRKPSTSSACIAVATGTDELVFELPAPDAICSFISLISATM